MAFYIGSLLQVAMLAIATTILNDHADHQSLANQNKFNPHVPYDYIVIGSGPAGSIIASRLSERPEITVLLLEEGSPETVTTDIPAMDAVNVFQPTNKLFQFLVEPQVNGAQGFPDKNFKMLTGRALGGGSVVNGMMYNRGGQLDYDGWERDYNATNWGWKDVLPLFRRSENQQDKELLKKTHLHAVGGPMTITSADFSQASPAYSLLTDAIIKAANENGFKNIDLNDDDQIGVARIQRYRKNGKRVSIATAYLKPAAGRPNLHILTGAKATRIVFDEHRRAHGVYFECQGVLQTAWVRKEVGGEVIVSAGAINSPKLLMLSGVGPREHLESLSIPVIADLPVGENFQDHTRVGGADFVCEKPIFTFWQDLLTVENLELFYVNGTGPLAQINYLHQDPIINVKTIVPTRGKLFGPSDLFIAPAIVPPPFVLLTGGEPFLNKDILEKYYAPNFGKPTLNFYTALNYVVSRGYVKLRSANPADPPIVNPRYFSDQDDLDRVVEAYKIALKLADTAAFKELGCKPYAEPLPGCEEFYKPDIPLGPRYISCKLKHLSASELHPAGSVRMAGVNDPSGVVDPFLKVKGIGGLRVADASIMPNIVSGNPQAATMMIGEKAAEMILAERLFKYSGLYYSGLQLFNKVAPYFYYQYY